MTDNRQINKNRPLLLAILDGWGLAEASASNAVSLGDTPNMDSWSSAYPMTTLVAHNGQVGLPEGQMGNSEVGHLNIGAGRIVYQDYTRINKAIASGEFSQNPVLVEMLEQVRRAGSALHLMGLLSDGGVHSHCNHLFSLLQMCKEKGLKRVFIHCFMDGRDTPPASGLKYMRQLVAEIERIGCGQVATVSGRYWAMDRDKRWERVEKAWQAMVEGQGQTALTAVEAVEAAYARQENDEFIVPTVLVDAAGQPLARIGDGDGVLMFNFRADRMRELGHAFGDSDFQGFSFSSGSCPDLLTLVTMTEYEADFPFPVAFPPQTLEHILGEELSIHGLRQLRIAETEKYAHVTYFFNGGAEEPWPGEERILIDSPRAVATYDQQPEMSAEAVTDALLEALEKNEAAGTPFEVIILNFANGDMVGHTGIIEAAAVACATVDRCLGRIQRFIAEREGVLLITADHGNAEIMRDPETGEPYTAHSLNPVPLLAVAEHLKGCRLRSGGALKDIAPTMLALLELPIPAEMEGENLLEC